jgi:uncharacterized phage-associated protein
MANVFDVAKYIIENLGPMTAMKLQKLVYYCQAWSLVWDERPLFPEKIQAWANGPVVYELFDAHRGAYLVDKDTFCRGDSNQLDEKAKETIDSVLKFYGDKGPQWLSDLTHAESPWRDARKGLPEDARCGAEITLESMIEYYSSIPN